MFDSRTISRKLPSALFLSSPVAIINSSVVNLESECDLTLISVLEVFAPSRIPTPPIAAPQTFLHADDVISVLPWID